MVLVRDQERPVRPRKSDRRDVPRMTRAPVRQQIHSIRIRSVLRVSMLLFAAVLTSLVLAGVVVWWMARVSGQLGALETFLADALGLEAFQLPGRLIFLGWTALAAFASMVGTALVMLLALVYNRVAELLGGIEIDSTLRPLRPHQHQA